MTPVKIGPSDLTHTIIESGVNQGDKIVVGPYKVLDNLKHDKKLKDEREVESEEDSDPNESDSNEPAK